MKCKKSIEGSAHIDPFSYKNRKRKITALFFEAVHANPHKNGDFCKRSPKFVNAKTPLISMNTQKRTKSKKISAQIQT